MSAAEKLRALHAQNRTVTLRQLAQIVAVVEALERVMKPWDNVKNPAVDEALAFARVALAALDEALA